MLTESADQRDERGRRSVGQGRRRRVNARHLVPLVFAGEKFVDGKFVERPEGAAA